MALSCLAALLAAEIVARRAAPRPGHVPYPAGSPSGLFHSHPRRGFTYAPGAELQVLRAGRSVWMRINEEGMRDGPLPEDPGIARVLVVGNSFTVGLGLPADQAWPSRLEELLDTEGVAAPAGVRVLNAAVEGHGLVEMRATVEDLLPEVRPSLVIAGVFVSGAHRVENPFVVLGGQIVRRDTAPYLTCEPDGFFLTRFSRPWLQGLDRWTSRYARIAQYLLRAGANLADVPVPPPPRHSPATDEEYLTPLLAELDRLAAFTRESGVPLVVLLVNWQDAGGEFLPSERQRNRIVAERCQALGVPCIDPLERLAEAAGGEPVLRLPGDNHWSALAHDTVARLLASRPSILAPLAPR